MVDVIRLDFIAFYAKDLLRTFYIKQTIEGVTSPYDLTGKTVELRVYDRSAPPALVFTLPTTAIGNGFAVVDFDIAETSQDSPVDFILVEDLGAEGEQNLQYGSINFIDLSKQVIPFKDMVENETPGNMVIPENFVNYKSYEWRLFLQTAITPNMTDLDLTNETAWPVQVNMLIAKLVVYDYIQKQLKQFLGSSTSTDQVSGAGIKKIETSPASVEYFDTINSLGDFFKADKSGKSPMSVVAQDICLLADKLRISLPQICGPLSSNPILPIIVRNRRCQSPTDYLLENFGE